MTLGGLALAIGMLVDDATVAVENIHRNQALGKPLTLAVLDGSSQIAVPAIVSTLAICVVFFPVVLLYGAAKYLFSPLALAVVSSMLASYILSRTLVPVLARMLLKDGRGEDDGGKGKPRGFFGRAALYLDQPRVRSYAHLQEVYGRGLETVMQHRVFTLIVAFSLAVISTGLVFSIGTDFFSNCGYRDDEAPFPGALRHPHRRD